MAGTPTKLEDLEPDLTQNSLAFLQRSIAGINTAAETSTPHQVLTFAVVDLAVAIEVLLKARLAREHWSLIISEVNKANVGNLLQGQTKTVTPDEALARLAGIAQVKLGSDSTVDRLKQAKDIVKLRNRAAHFTLANESEAGIRAQLGTGLAFALWFLGTEFQPATQSPSQALVTDVIAAISSEIGKIDDLVSARMAELETKLAAAVVCLDCPTCKQPALVFDDAGAHCLFCLAAGEDGPTLAEAYVADVLDLTSYAVLTDGGEWPVHECPNCSEEAFVFGITPRRSDLYTAIAEQRADGPLPYAWGCFACALLATAAEVQMCTWCGRPTLDHNICGDCAADRMARD
jgi:hypothetical protein